MTYKSKDPEMETELVPINLAISKINRRLLCSRRHKPHLILTENKADLKDDGPELFTAQPSDDIPRNKLTEKLARGLQSYV